MSIYKYIIYAIFLCIHRQGSAVDYVIGFKSLVHFLTHETTPHKTELKQTILYPLFLCCYISLVAMDESDKGEKLHLHSHFMGCFSMNCQFFYFLFIMTVFCVALSLYSSLEDIINKVCTNSHDIKELLLLNGKESLETSLLAEKFRFDR